MQEWLQRIEVLTFRKYSEDNREVMAKIIVTQVKSAIKRPKDQKATLVALGIKKLHNPKEHEATPQILGMVRKVSHLVTVTEK